MSATCEACGGTMDDYEEDEPNDICVDCAETGNAARVIATLRADLARVTAERDRMQPVVEAAVKLSHHHGAMVTLSDAVDDYLDAEPKEGE